MARGLAPALGLPVPPSHIRLPSGPGEGGKRPRGKAEQPGGRRVALEGLQQEAGRSRDPEPRADGQGAAGQGAAAHGGARGGSGGGPQAHQAGTRPSWRGHRPCRELCRRLGRAALARGLCRAACGSCRGAGAMQPCRVCCSGSSSTLRCAPCTSPLLPAAVQRVPAAAPGLDGRGGAGPGGAAGHGHEPGGDQVPAG